MSAIRIENLSFSYDNKKEVLKNINLVIKENAITVILGKNGSGKSTLIDCILGNNYVKTGNIYVKNKKLTEYSPSELARNIAYIPQSTISNMDFTVFDFILFGRNCYLKLGQSPTEKDYELVEEKAADCKISHLLNKSINSISGGERQLVFIARALVQDAPIIVMDEPTSALDLENQHLVLSAIKQIVANGKTVVMSSHNPNHALFLDGDAVMLKDGEVFVFGQAQDIVNIEKLTFIYGDKVCLSSSLDYDEITFRE